MALMLLLSETLSCLSPPLTPSSHFAVPNGGEWFIQSKSTEQGGRERDRAEEWEEVVDNQEEQEGPRRSGFQSTQEESFS